MSRSDAIGPIIMLVIVALVVYFLFIRKGTNWATDAGAWAAKIAQPVVNQYNVASATLKGAIEGSGTPEFVDTPLGYLPSNQTWTLSDGSKLGLPQGMTPKEFCRMSPGSPVCSHINGG